MSPTMRWPAGSPFTFSQCHYCKAPIVRGQLEHTCVEDSGLHEAAKAQEQRIAAQQAEMVAEVEARLTK